MVSRTEATQAAWYHQPVVWLGALIFAASLAGCVLMIVLGARHADEPIATRQGEILRVPTAKRAAPDTRVRDMP